MALLWIEGFEGFGDTTGVTPQPTGIVGRKYPDTNGEAYFIIEVGRNSLGLEIQAITPYTQHFKTPSLTTNATLVCGLAFKVSAALPTTPSNIISFFEGSNYGINIRINNNGTISAYLGSSTLLGTSTNSLGVGQWYYIELKVLTNNTMGTIEVKVNHSTWLNLTSQDTQPGSNVYHDAVYIGNCHTHSQFDDMYVLDGSGTINNDFLGTRRVSAIRPNAAGDSTQWTPDSGNNYDRVNEVELDEDTSYVETGTTTDKDLYNYDPTVNMTSIDGIQIMTEIKATSGSMELQNLTKSGSTENAQSCGTIISTDYVTCPSVGEVNPDTSNPWTPAEIDAAQFGIKAI